MHRENTEGNFRVKSGLYQDSFLDSYRLFSRYFHQTAERSKEARNQINAVLYDKSELCSYHHRKTVFFCKFVTITLLGRRPNLLKLFI